MAEALAKELIVKEQKDKMKIAAKLKIVQVSDVLLTLLVALMTFLFSVAVVVQAGGPIGPPSKLDEILARSTLRVGMPGDYLPFGLGDKATGLWKGLDVDEAVIMAKTLGVKLEIRRSRQTCSPANSMSGPAEYPLHLNAKR